MVYQNTFGTTPTQASYNEEHGSVPPLSCSSSVNSSCNSSETSVPPLIHDDSSCSDSSSNEEYSNYLTAISTCTHSPRTSIAYPGVAVPTPSTPNTPGTPATIREFYFNDKFNSSTTTLTSHTATYTLEATTTTTATSTRRSRRYESPSNLVDQPVRKAPRYAACLTRFCRKEEDLYSNCDALGGF